MRRRKTMLKAIWRLSVLPLPSQVQKQRYFLLVCRGWADILGFSGPGCPNKDLEGQGHYLEPQRWKNYSDYHLLGSGKCGHSSKFPGFRELSTHHSSATPFHPMFCLTSDAKQWSQEHWRIQGRLISLPCCLWIVVSNDSLKGYYTHKYNSWVTQESVNNNLFPGHVKFTVHNLIVFMLGNTFSRTL